MGLPKGKTSKIINIMLYILRKILRFIKKYRLERIPLLMRIFLRVYHLIKSKSVFLTPVQNFKMYVDPRSSTMSHQLILEGIYEKFETSLFKKELKSGMTIVDIGANWGYYTILSSKLVGNEGRIIAFEPEPFNFSLLIRNIEINGCKNVKAIRKAISNKTGMTNLYLCEDNLGDHQIYCSDDRRECIEIETISLDEYFCSATQPIDIIKIDTQGAEMAILMGMDKTLKENNNIKIFTEFWPRGMKQFAYSPIEYLQRLKGYGFKLFLIDERRGILEPINIEDCIKTCPDDTFINLFLRR